MDSSELDNKEFMLGCAEGENMKWGWGEWQSEKKKEKKNG